MFKLFAIVLLSWAVAIQAAELPSEVVAVLPAKVAHTATHYDGQDTMFIMGGYDGLNLHDGVLCYNISKLGLIEQVGTFPTGITQGSSGYDGEGNFFYIGGDVGGKSDDVWQLHTSSPVPLKFGKLPEPTRLSCSVSDNMGNVYMIGGAEGNLEVRKNIVKYNTKTNVATVVAQLPIGLYGTSCAMVEGTVYVFGGFNTNFHYSTDILKFTPETNEIEVLHMVFGGEGLLYSSAVTVGRDIYIVGGMSPNGVVHQVTKFDPITLTLDAFTLPNHTNMFAGISTAYVPHTNRIYVIGGYTFENNVNKWLDQIFFIQLDYMV